MTTPASTGASHQYLRTAERLFFFFFLLNRGGSHDFLVSGGRNSGDQILVCYNPNSSPAEARRRCTEIQPMKPAHAASASEGNTNPKERHEGCGAFSVCLLIAIAPGWRRRKSKKKEEITQTLQLPKELPGAVIGETRRFTFHVTPLSARGLLSAQVRDALKALTHETGGNPVLKIRAFVAGSGDLRRVRDLVSEAFTDSRLPLPSLSLIQAGGLPLEGAQVVLEAIAAGKKEVNPQGLVFLSAPVATSDESAGPGGTPGGEIARAVEGSALKRPAPSPGTWCA